MSELNAELSRLHDYAGGPGMPCAHGGPLGTGTIRAEPADFCVSETLPFVLCGAGEHWYVRLRKTGQNTQWVARQLAEIAGMPYRTVSYAGLKDRHAVAEQWFSLHLAGRSPPDLEEHLPEGVELVATDRHDRKLRQGQVEANRFELRIRDCAAIDADLLAARVADIRQHGIPNYFGPQRFGQRQGNLNLARKANDLRKLARDERSFALSALRGALFNGYLAERIRAGTWHECLPGEVAISGRPRQSDESAATTGDQARGPSGLLWGQGGKSSGKRAMPGEQPFFARFPEITGLLERSGARASRRRLQVFPADLNVALNGNTLNMTFALPAGSFATSVLRELLDVRDHALPVAEVTESGGED